MRQDKLWANINLAFFIFLCSLKIVSTISARDLKILGPVFSHSSNILAKEKAIAVSLEAIKLIVTAEEVLILDPLRPEVLSLVDRLKQQFPQSHETRVAQESSLLDPEAAEDLQSHHELPFEFQVLEIALKVVCSFVDSSVVALETEALPVLDELTKNVSTENLDYVRSLKSNLTSLLARVQKVRDEIEHLLDDNKDMADLYLTRKWIQSQQQSKALVLGGTTSKRSSSMVTCNNTKEDEDVEDLEMLLEVYFTQFEGVRNKILTVREYIDDTEDFVNIQLDNRRNELLQMKLVLSIAT
ncbi:unnamed protein product [Microthlaspi erraticum]|uniref:Magnesium transporter n=1 Tax=Microthlaspi erraticum TaxID=1685480 RepID=A0A6D2JGP3_9BRAS|nr:unnamed protein product [Microthlaspi erraticum]